MRREAERVTEIEFRLVIPVDRLIDQPRKEVKHLLGSGIGGDVTVFARDDQRLADFFHDLETTGALELDALHADVGAAEVERKELAGLFTRRQPDVGFEHAQRGILGIVEPELEVLTEIRGDFAELLRIDCELVDERLQLLSVQCHFNTSLLLKMKSALIIPICFGDCTQKFFVANDCF